MAGSTFTIGTQFGVSSGPTYTGSTNILPDAIGTTGNTVLNPSALVLANTLQTLVEIYPNAISNTSIEAYGFAAQTTNLNSNVNTPVVTVQFRHAASNTNITLLAGQALAWANNSAIPAPITAIYVKPDVTSDVQVDGLITIDVT